VKSLFQASLVGILVVVIDQFLKLIHLEKSLNSGGLFGFEQDNLLWVLVHIGVIVLLAFYLIPRLYTKYRLPAIFTIIVSLSNLSDRILIGGVVDYFQLLGIWFNLADVFIVVTPLILILWEIVDNGKNRSNKK